MGGWTWIQALNFSRTHLHHIGNNLKVPVIMFVSARLERPSHEVYLRFNSVPKQFLGDQTQTEFADL